MAARAKGGGADWDDFNTTQYDDDCFSSDGVPVDHYKLYVTNLPIGLGESGLADLFGKYGKVATTYLSKDPSKRFAIIKFETPGEANIAMMKLNRTEPLKLYINFAHLKKPEKHSKTDRHTDRHHSNTDRQMVKHNERHRSGREDSSSVSSKGQKPRMIEYQINDDEVDDETEGSEEMDINRNLHYNLETLKLKQLELKEKQLECQQRILMIQQAEKLKTATASVSKRRILPNGRIVIQNGVDITQDNDTCYTAGVGDSNETCSCQKTSWTREDTDGSSTPSTCVLCSEGPSPISKVGSKTSKVESTTVTVSKSRHSECSKVTDTFSKKSDATSKKCEVRKCACRAKSDMTCDLKFRDFYAESDDGADETNRLIQMRNSDYLDIVDDELKLVIALAGYPKSKMRLRQMELFQRCLNEVLEMQAKAGLLLKEPSFNDYYLNRGAIVCVCKDLDTRDWLVRISPGLQERMCYNLILLNAKVKRLCLAVLKIPRVCWPTTAQDAFKLLQYFNPPLKTNLWKIYAQKVIDDVECTSFLIDRVSGEIIRGPSFKNVIDYDQMEFELTGYTEIYYECLLSGMEEDLSSVASRVKLLEQIKSAQSTPRITSTASMMPADNIIVEEKEEIDTAREACETIDKISNETHNISDGNHDISDENHDISDEYHEISGEAKDRVVIEEIDMKKELESALQDDVLKKIKDVQYIGDNDEILVWSDDTTHDREADDDDFKRNENKDTYLEERLEESQDQAVGLLQAATTTTSLVALSEQSSIVESNYNLMTKSSAINIDSNRGIAYHRRTNYLHVENELKVAITLEGYPSNKLEGTHIRRLKHLFKEYLHKDMKSQRFTNMIIPKFQDIYLSNGAVIYICDSLETKDYLTEVLPKFINSTGLKLAFRDVKNLVRYTRIVMRLPKEQAHIESIEILMKLEQKYPGLKPDCWKYYSDVAGKQKREFGVDPGSLEVIKSPDFDPMHEGEKLTFRIIDRQKRDISCDETAKSEETESIEIKKQREFVAKNMYAPIVTEILNAPLTKIRTNHYSDLIADDLKLYVGPTNYPDTRIDETQFHTIKRSFEIIVAKHLETGDLTEESMPKFHDMYLFDGVIFVICKNMSSRIWIEKNLAFVNDKLKICLKSTEFRGAVGIVSLVVKTDKETDDVIAILQRQNPRLRTKYWRKISTVRTATKLDVILQIDKLSAQVIMDPEFKKRIGSESAEFTLGHLRSLIKPKESLEQLMKAKTIKKKTNKSKRVTKKKSNEIAKAVSKVTVDKTSNSDVENNNSPKIHESDVDPIIIEPESPRHKQFSIPDNDQTKIILKIPTNILPDNEEDLTIILDILEDKNPGLNTEIWEIYSEDNYPSNGKFVLYVDNQSLAVIQSRSFVPLRNIPRLQRSARCVACGGVAAAFCSGCGVTPYCGELCQKRDWIDRHRSVCHNLARLPDADEEDATSEPMIVSEPPRQSQNARGESQLPRNDIGSDRVPKKSFPFGLKNISTQKIPTKSSQEGNRGRGQNANKSQDWKIRQENQESGGNRNQESGGNRNQESGGNRSQESGGNRSQESGGNRNQDSGGNRNQESGGNRNQDTARRLPSKVDTEQDVAQRQPLRKPDIQKAPKAAKPVQIEPPTKTESVKSEDGGKVASIKDVTPRKPIVPDSYLMEKLPLGSTFLASVEATTADCASHQPGYVCLTLHEDYSEVYAQLCDDFTAHCERDKDEYIPRIGETFAYYHAEDGAWYRARCLTRTRAALIDSPRVLSLSNNGRRLPASYTGVPEFATVLRTGSLQVGSNLRCTLVEKTANGFLVNLEDSETGLVVGQAEAMRWIPEVEYPAQDPTPAKLTPVQPTPVQPTPVQSTSAQPTPVQPAPVRASAAAEMPRPPILHNTNYVLLDVTSLGRACVRPCDPKSTAEFDSAIHDTVLYGIDAVPLEQPPSKGQSVVARFSDGTHYRAFVKRTNVAKNKYLIEYVEFGNEETVPIERLYPCPAALQLSAKPAQASLVALSHRKPPELTSRATEYIDVLKDNAQQLILTIPGGAKQAASGSLVILLNAQNCEPVSRKIEELCTPEWKKLEERGGDVLEMECRMFSDLKYIPLPQSRPFTLAVTYCEPSSLASGVLNGYEKGADMARCVYTELSDQIQEYCASPLCREPYLPKLEELCITKHYRLDKWVRSVFIKLSGSAGSKVAQVCAIDYGDIMEVPVYEIRKMMPEFIDEYPALANHCDIKGFPENPSKVQLERVIGVLNLSPNGVGEVKVDSCQDEGDNMYEITASELMAALAV